jgi:SNF2 family DNA or RNA helicase
MSAPALLPYQNIGAAFLAERRHAALFDEMGVGKTAQAIHGANLAGVRRALVVSPHIGLINWQREIATWGRNKVSAILTNRFTDGPQPWHVINYDLLQENTQVLTALRDRPYDLLILDECQALKNHNAARTTNIYGRRGVARMAERVWLVSGSPCPNHVGELYPALLALFPQVIKTEHPTARRDGLLSYEGFIHKYCRTQVDARGEEKIIGSRSVEVIKLKDMLRPYMLRRTLAEVLPDLPPLRFSTVSLDPRHSLLLLENSIEQIEILQTLRAAVANADPEEQDDAFIQALNDMETEALSTQRRRFGEAKVPLVAEAVHYELNAGLDKVVIFYHHQSVGLGLCRALEKYGASRIDGSIDPRWRQPVIDAFQNDSSRRVLLVSLDCGSTVITLTAAAHVIFAECSWTPLTNVQAARRCARLGQRRPVLARFMSLAGSLDEIIIAVQARKARALSYLFATSDTGEETHAFRPA